MNAGNVKGMICIGQNPATSINAKLERSGLRKLEWLVVKDNWLTETATFWKNAPEVKNGEVKTADIKTEVFFLPATQVAELEGTFTNTQRLLQFHHKAAEAPGDCRSDTLFTYDLGKRLKKLYADSTAAARRGLQKPRLGLRARERSRAQEGRAFGAENSQRDQRLFHRRSRRAIASVSASSRTTARRPAPRGSTRASIPRRGQAARRPAHSRPARQTRRATRLGLGVAGQPAGDVQPRLGRPRRQALERKKEVGLVGRGGKKMGRLRRA